ncbi:MAG: hypothetical protein U0X86_000553 [Wolbachia endosymbiont of Xenopsylla cheopis]
MPVIYLFQDAVDVLIKAGSNVDIQDQDGRTALMFVIDNYYYFTTK